ncbi:hypothetical protein ACLKA7_015346 [Drosophila subpalustris]
MTGAAQDRFRTVLGHLPPRLYINHGQHTSNANTERDKTNTVDIRNFTTLQENSTAINKTNNKRTPVPDPGVPALPEMTT